MINNTLGAGYYRPLDAHQAYNVPLTMHITPTLASAIQWAKADPNSLHPYRDGPALNARIASMIQAGTIDLLGTTFSDHMLDYFPDAYNTDNVGLANDFLSKIYGAAPSSKVLWTPERVSDSGVLQKVTDLGFNYTFVDQMRHIFKWFGRSSALGDDGYRINQINNTKAFIINDTASTYLLQNSDNGLPDSDATAVESQGARWAAGPGRHFRQSVGGFCDQGERGCVRQEHSLAGQPSVDPDRYAGPDCVQSNRYFRASDRSRHAMGHG